LVFFDCIFEALSRNITLAADCLGSLYLVKSRACVPDWEEKLWIFVETAGLI
jgi:hypothetical protein